MKSLVTFALVIFLGMTLFREAASAEVAGPCSIAQVGEVHSALTTFVQAAKRRWAGLEVSIGLSCGTFRSVQAAEQKVAHLVLADRVTLKQSSFAVAFAGVADTCGHSDSKEFAHLQQVLGDVASSGSFEIFSGSTGGEDRHGILMALIERATGRVLVLESQLD